MQSNMEQESHRYGSELILKYKQVLAQRDALEDLLIAEQMKNGDSEMHLRNFRSAQSELRASQEQTEEWKSKCMENAKEVQRLSKVILSLEEKVRELEDTSVLKNEIERLQAELGRSETLRFKTYRQQKERLQAGGDAIQHESRNGNGKDKDNDADVDSLMKGQNASHRRWSSDNLSSTDTAVAVDKSDVALLRSQISSQKKLITELETDLAAVREALESQKIRAADEADDMTQAMAELRYELMQKVEEERELRAQVEAASVQRVQELEAQVSAAKEEVVRVLAQRSQVEQRAEQREASVRIKERQLAGLADDLRKKAAALRAQVAQAEAKATAAMERCHKAEARIQQLEGK